MFPRRWLEFKKIAKECALYLFNSVKALGYKWLEVLIEENAGPIVQEKIKPQVEKIQNLVIQHIQLMIQHKVNIIAAYSCAIADECGIAPDPYPCKIHARAAVKIYEFNEAGKEPAVAVA